MSLYVHAISGFRKIKEALSTAYAKVTIPLKGDVSIGKKLRVRGIVYIENYGKIKIGDNVTINSSNWANPIGCGRKTFIKTYSTGQVLIGNNVGMSNCALVSEKSGIIVGNNVLLGGG